MSEKSKCFTFIWKIKNFSFMHRSQFSPSFFVQEMGETKWKIELYPKSNRLNDCVACYFCRDINDPGPDQYKLNYELSFLASDGSVLHSEKYLDKEYRRGHFDRKQVLHVKRDEVGSLKKDLYIPHDTLTIRCRMWSTQKNISQSGKCFAKSLIEIECRCSVGTIEKFSCIEPRGKYPVCIKSASTETFLSSMNLYVAADGKLDIEIKLDSGYVVENCKCKIFIKYNIGNKMKIGKSEFNGHSQSIPLTCLKEHLIENKNRYLPNDGLTIECKVILPTGNKIEKIDEPKYSFDYQDTREMVSNVTKTNLYSEERHTESLTTLKEDLISLFSEGILCDTKLKTATETFPAHTAVLSARSPVFKSMFTIDMKEKTNRCVDIDDLDTDTVRRMLLFMYSDTLDDLQFESAKSLYFAADKYHISSLRQRCSNFLKQNLLEANCCEALLLADKHQDEILKNAVQDYITKNDEVVLFSDEWKNLEKNHPQLSIEILRAVYVRNRKS